MKNSILFSLEDDLSIKCKLFIRRVLVKAQYGSSETNILEVKCYAFVCDCFNCCSSLCFFSTVNMINNTPHLFPLILSKPYGFPNLKLFRYTKRPFDPSIYIKCYRKSFHKIESK